MVCAPKTFGGKAAVEPGCGVSFPGRMGGLGMGAPDGPPHCGGVFTGFPPKRSLLKRLSSPPRPMYMFAIYRPTRELYATWNPRSSNNPGALGKVVPIWKRRPFTGRTPPNLKSAGEYS